MQKFHFSWDLMKDFTLGLIVALGAVKEGGIADLDERRPSLPPWKKKTLEREKEGGR